MTTAEQLTLRYPVGYDIESAAIVAGVHTNTIRYAIKHGHILPLRSPTGMKKISPAELARWIEWRAEKQASN